MHSISFHISSRSLHHYNQGHEKKKKKTICLYQCEGFYVVTIYSASPTLHFIYLFEFVEILHIMSYLFHGSDQIKGKNKVVWPVGSNS